MFNRWKPLVVYALRRANVAAVRHMPLGTRLGAGLVFMTGGVFGFLPILGFWMIPVGAFLAASEFPILRRRMQKWLTHKKKTLTPFERRNPKAAAGFGGTGGPAPK